MKRDSNNATKYLKVYDRRKKLFGIKEDGRKNWYVEPMFEELGFEEWDEDELETWFKLNGKYGYYNIRDKRVVIPALYGYPLYFKGKGFAITWKDYKAGVIDIEGNVKIPFVYDAIEGRYQQVPIPKEEQHTVTTSDGIVHYVGPTHRTFFHGYACFTNEGDVQVYDINCNHDEFYEWEQERLKDEPEYNNKNVGAMSLEELEETIKEEYLLLLELGYEAQNTLILSQEHKDKNHEQERKVKSLLHDRRQKMNRSWMHNVENVKRIGRMNKLLMRAVRKAIKLGEKTSRSLQWMEKVSNTAHYVVEVYVHPEWQNSQSDLRYERKFKSASKEHERLFTDENNVSDTHIWNIIASMGGWIKYHGVGVCFEGLGYKYDLNYWNEKKLIEDNGQSHDEYIHFPAYQDEYFTMPFRDLFCDFDFSFEDLCNINDFRVNVNVQLVTREQD